MVVTWIAMNAHFPLKILSLAALTLAGGCDTGGG